MLINIAHDLCQLHLEVGTALATEDLSTVGNQLRQPLRSALYTYSD